MREVRVDGADERKRELARMSGSGNKDSERKIEKKKRHSDFYEKNFDTIYIIPIRYFRDILRYCYDTHVGYNELKS